MLGSRSFTKLAIAKDNNNSLTRYAAPNIRFSDLSSGILDRLSRGATSAQFCDCASLDLERGSPAADIL